MPDVVLLVFGATVLLLLAFMSFVRGERGGSEVSLPLLSSQAERAHTIFHEEARNTTRLESFKAAKVQQVFV
ncbi:MAG: hypothetical protein DRP94_09165, partial [Candidatus Latescibacterota bacterium]